MRGRASILALTVASTLSGVPFAGAPARAAETGQVLVVPHQSGSLALPTARISSVWYRQGASEAPSQLRIASPALTEAKLLTGGDADALWQTVHEGALASRFVFIPHMEGTLGIPRDQIRTAYYSEDGGQATLRLQYEGDPSGKTVAGAEATRIWKALAE